MTLLHAGWFQPSGSSDGSRAYSDYLSIYKGVLLCDIWLCIGVYVVGVGESPGGNIKSQASHEET